MSQEQKTIANITIVMLHLLIYVFLNIECYAVYQQVSVQYYRVSYSRIFMIQNRSNHKQYNSRITNKVCVWYDIYEL